MPLYKFTKKAFARSAQDGNLLFRNLTYYKQHYDDQIGDYMEGCHVDSPDHDVTITTVSHGFAHPRDLKNANPVGTVISGAYSMRTRISEEKVFVHCLSTEFDEAMFAKFGADACLVINDVPEFERRCKKAGKNIIPFGFDRRGLVAGEVEYFDPTKNIKRDIDKGEEIPFLKHLRYKDQKEFRLAIARTGGFDVEKRLIINRDWDTVPDHLQGVPKDLPLSVGSIADISEIIDR